MQGKYLVSENYIENFSAQIVKNCSKLHHLNEKLTKLLLSHDDLFKKYEDKFCLDFGENANGDLIDLVLACQDIDQDIEDFERILQSRFGDHNDDHQATTYILDTIPENDNNCDLSGVRAFFTFVVSVSLLFLIIALSVYFFNSEYASMNGKIVMANIIATIFVHFYFLSVFYTTPGGVGCSLLGFFGYFSNLSMFAWMSVMCGDLCWTFYKVQLPTGSHTKKFLVYCSLGFGIPFLMTLLLLIIQVNIGKL